MPIYVSDKSASRRPWMGMGVVVGKRFGVVVAALAMTVPVLGAVSTTKIPEAASAQGAPQAAYTNLRVSADVRRAPLRGLYDWSKAGFGKGSAVPGPAQLNPDPACQVTAAELAGAYKVVPGDGVDDTDGLQAAIDHVRDQCSPTGSYTKLSKISLPAGTIDVSREIHVDADYLLIRGAGSDPKTGSRLVYRPDENTRYDAVTPDGADWDEDNMGFQSARGGWLWPGRGLFRVQSRGVHPTYQSEHAAAPANRKDLYEGTINVHWKVGLKLQGQPGDENFAARQGDTVVQLSSRTKSSELKTVQPGTLVNVRAANSLKFYEYMQALPTAFELLNLHMRQQIFRVVAVDAAAKTVSIDKPLEYDVPVSSVSDGSAPIAGVVYLSKLAPLVDPVVGVGFENLSFTQAMPALKVADAVHNYGNMAPDLEMHGIVFKWAANSWVRGIRAEMTGSHPIVTEEASKLSIIDNYLDGSWNKGKGGNGYFRGSRVWDSLYAGNTTRNLRHFTFQWSASGNVVIGNDFDSDLNLHGGYERHNLFEMNKVTVPYGHRPGNCDSNCGAEGDDPVVVAPVDDSNWYPIWWGAGKKAIKWSGSSGPRNVFFNNNMTKQLSPSGAFVPYYADRTTVYQFGWDGARFRHLDKAGTAIADWAKQEEADYTNGHGVDDTFTHGGQSLFLKTVGKSG